MKDAKRTLRRVALKKKLTPRKTSSTPARKRKTSTAESLLKHATGWAGDDLDKLLQVVRDARSETQF